MGNPSAFEKIVKYLVNEEGLCVVISRPYRSLDHDRVDVELRRQWPSGETIQCTQHDSLLEGIGDLFLRYIREEYSWNSNQVAAKVLGISIKELP